MPVPGFITSITDKAQSAFNASPLAAHLPGRTGSPDNNQSSESTHKSHALDAIQYQLRAFGQQYSNTTPVQKIITMEKGVAIDFDSVSRDAKAQSKELYTWGQAEHEDLKDVTDRLAYLNFVQGSLASSLAVKLDSARAPLKALRDAEAAILPRRNIRDGMRLQLARLEHEQQKGMEKKISELKDQIKKAELDDGPQEREIELLKRKGVRESEQLKWEAIREYGEKLVLLSQTATPIIAALPTLPPSATQPYTGAQATGAARASLQRALDNYKTGHINLPPQLAGSDLSRSDTRSFGESHASELSSISTDPSASLQSGITSSPPSSAKPLSSATASHPPSAFHSGSASIPLSDKIQSPPINPNALNQSPASIPVVSSATSPPPVISPDPSKPASSLPVITPTVAETGVPVTAGADGPGPASGSLHDIKGASPLAGPRSGGLPANEAEPPSFGQLPTNSPSYLSAADEKKRLQGSYAQGEASSQASAPSSTDAPHYETAEEEKKRLEREERERLLRGGADQPPAPPKKDDDLPPYQDI